MMLLLLLRSGSVGLRRKMLQMRRRLLLLLVCRVTIRAVLSGIRGLSAMHRAISRWLRRVLYMRRRRMSILAGRRRLWWLVAVARLRALMRRTLVWVLALRWHLRIPSFFLHRRLLLRWLPIRARGWMTGLVMQIGRAHV